MADNVRIVGNILNVTSFNTRYKSEDLDLISSRTLKNNFGGTGDYIEFYLKDVAGTILSISYNYLNYKLPSSSFLAPGVENIPNTTGSIQTTDVGITSTLATPTSSLYPIIEIDPIKDIQNSGYSSGEFQAKYNLFTNVMSDYINQALFIKEISRDRTELRLASTIIPDEDIESITLSLIDEINNSDYFVDFLLNFGQDRQIVAVNIALNKNPEGFEVLFKLYEPLPVDIREKQTLWVVREKSFSYNFSINLDKIVTPAPPPFLRGPNFNIEIENQGTVATSYQNYSTLITNLQSLQNSSYQQIQSLLATQSIDINIDYSNFDNFVFFGSAYQRVNNFYNKVKQIEDYNIYINYNIPYVSTTASLQSKINQASASINDIITKFDGFEYYLYFNSSSLTSSAEYSITPYPKSGSLLPYTLYSTSSVNASDWYDYAVESATNYDANNYDNLIYAVPSFVRDDQSNQPFLLFLNMVGHYFDNIWVYLRTITDINLANNNLDYGVSRDLVYQQLKSLGIKLYNSQAGDSVDGYLIGANTGSVVWDNNFTITGSYLNNIPRKDLVAELYKRIYHNLPLLVKTKGTVTGLNSLMSIFGIPNRDYYTIYSGSNYETFYTPTGSAVTSSILNVKEFGGSLKSNLVDGYNNDKVRIVQNNITGSVLSPYLPLQTFPTASSAFRDDDLHYVDISFSPQTQIDTYISEAIASNNPTWSLDDYIGDPGQSYSGSYPDLDAQRKLYFETGVSGFNPFTASLLDYNGFIRLIEFFDNSLFKMLNDFVPERTSLSTGVTINSPVLERNKVAYSKPTVTTQSVYEANYDIASISSSYGTFYNALAASNNTMGWYDGELSGSVVDVNQYFEDNYNPYLGDWDVWNAQHTINEQINLNTFLHSDWNVLLNNVSKSVNSQYRQKIEYFYGTTSSLTHSAELQDSYLSLRSYNTSRYEGSKVTSLLLNTYTSASYTGSDGFTIQLGDKSFGKTAVIDRNSIKFAIVRNIPSKNLNFLDKTQISIKYLVDENSNLLELNYRNFNLFEVQNTFKSGTPTILSLSDVTKPSNQRTLDGTKPIFLGGFRCEPYLVREGNVPINLKFTTAVLSSSSTLNTKIVKSNNYTWYRDSAFPGRNPPPFTTQTEKWTTKVFDGANDTIKYILYTKEFPQGYRAVGGAQFFSGPPLSNTSYTTQNFPYIQAGTSDPNNKAYKKENYFRGSSFTVDTGANAQTKIWSTESTYYLIDYKFNNPDNKTFDSFEYNQQTGQFKVIKDSNFTTKVTLPIHFGASYLGTGEFIEWKITGFLQKSLTPDVESSWWQDSNKLAVADLTNVVLEPGTLQGISSTSTTSNITVIDNAIRIRKGSNLYISETTRRLTGTLTTTHTGALSRGEYIRFIICFYDTSNTLLTPPSISYGQLVVGINCRGTGTTVSDSVTVYDTSLFSTSENIAGLLAASNFIQEVTGSLFTTSSQSQDLLILSQNLSDWASQGNIIQIIDSGSVLEDLYTPILEPINIEVGDLVRLSSISSPFPAYYNVKDITTIPQTTTTSLNSITNIQPFINVNTLRFMIEVSPNTPVTSQESVYLSNMKNLYNSINIGDSLRIYDFFDFIGSAVLDGSGNPLPTLNVTVTNKSTVNQTSPISYLAGVIEFTPGDPNFIEGFYEGKVDLTENKSVIILSSNIIKDVYLGDQSFAFFKVRPDETSVIINFRKTPGEVSPTLLLPSDLQKQILENVGEISNKIDSSILLNN